MKLFFTGLLCFFISLCSISPSWGQDEASTEIQTTFFVKILRFVKNISSLETINVGVVFDNNPKSVSSRDKIINLLKSDRNIRIIAVDSNTPDNKLQLLNALYLSEEVSAENISQKAKKLKILTFSSDFQNVKNDLASVTVILKDNKPKIVVNLGNSKMEGQIISAQLLKLAEIINKGN